jgi:ergothioneine biosynthesis protein EgtB
VAATSRQDLAAQGATRERESAPAGEDLLAELAEARKRTDELFAWLEPQALLERPVAQRHRLAFYLGHLEAFDWNLIAPGLGLQPFRPGFDRLFAFGIDPQAGALPSEPASAWPVAALIREYVAESRARLDRRLADEGTELTERGEQILAAAIEHRLMHAETLAWLISRLPAELKRPPPHEPPRDGRVPQTARVSVPRGIATLGRPRSQPGFAWDNEFEALRVAVDAFEIDAHDVTNAQFLRFVEEGGYRDPKHWSEAGWRWRQARPIDHPAGWRREGDSWLARAMWGERPLPGAWPVYVSQFEAEAYASWSGARLPTEPELQRATWGSPEGERSFPWGEDPPDETRGTFGFSHWDPSPAGSHPRGASALGAHDLVGNGWEWTTTPFAPLPGFEILDFYPGYSRDFFDGEHCVLKGASPRTALRLLRRSFRNWMRPGTDFAFATFRTVRH